MRIWPFSWPADKQFNVLSFKEPVIGEDDACRESLECAQLGSHLG